MKSRVCTGRLVKKPVVRCVPWLKTVTLPHSLKQPSDRTVCFYRLFLRTEYFSTSRLLSKAGDDASFIAKVLCDFARARGMMQIARE